MKALLARSGLLAALTLTLCAAVVRAQESPRHLDSAVMFDEYGRIGGCDHSARLDNWAIQLQNDSNLEGSIVYYGPESASNLTLDIIKDYLVNSRGIAEERFKTVYAGPNSDPAEPRVQLWLAPRGALAPELVRYEKKVETFDGLFSERQRWDGLPSEGEGTGPPVPDVTIPSFIDMLKKQPETVAYLVSFNGADAAPGAWRRVAQLESERFEHLGLEANRIKTIYGGSAKETKIQFWILPKTAPPPLINSGAEPLPEKTIQIGTFSDYSLAEEYGERYAFKGFLDVLRSSENLRAFIIVRLESDEPEEESEEEPAAQPEGQPEPKPVEESITDVVPAEPVASDEIPSADLLKLVEKWKVELADKFKIDQNRFIVLFARASKYSGNSLETWIVPAGALPPDPNVDLDGEVSEEAESESAANPKDVPLPDHP